VDFGWGDGVLCGPDEGQPPTGTSDSLRAAFESWLYHLQLADLGQVTPLVWASVSSTIKW
jgi:hypothetical protein